MSHPWACPLHRLAQEVERRRGAVQASLAGDAPKLAAVLHATAGLKRHAEGALGAQLGRPVHIVGDINTVLQA